MIGKSIMKVGQGLLQKPVTLEFPEQREELTDNYRGIHKLDIKTCISCTASF